MIKKYFFLLTIVFACACSSSKVQKSTSVVTPPPAKKEEAKETSIDKGKKELPSEIKFSLLMPFNISENLSEHDSTESGEPAIDPASMPFIQFYEGAELAIDSLKKQNIMVKLFPFDMSADSTGAVNIMYKQQVMQSDIIFSGLNSGMNAPLSSIAKIHNNRFVAVQPTSGSILKNNPHAVLTLPSTIMQCSQANAMLLKKYPGAEFFILHRDIKKENDIALLFHKQLDSLQAGVEPKVILHDVLYDAKSFENFQSTLSQLKRNIILITSSDEAFISPLLAKINSYNYANIIVAGLPTWENFETTDFSEMKNLQIIYFTGSYIDYENPRIKRFRKKFLETYHTDPVLNAYLGFDLVYYFAKRLAGGKENIETDLEKNKIFDDASFYRFSRASDTDGLENSSITILQFKDYKVIKVE